MHKVFKIFFILALLSGCSTTDEERLCFTGPVKFTFEIVDESTGENLFAEGLYEENQVRIKNNEGETLEFDFETERSVIEVVLGWKSKSDAYTVTIGEEIEFSIVFTLEELSSGGCTSIKLKELEVVGATIETSETSNINTIVVNRGNN